MRPSWETSLWMALASWHGGGALDLQQAACWGFQVWDSGVLSLMR